MAVYLARKAQEKQDILHFTMDCLKVDPEGKILTRQLFEGYHVWRKLKGMSLSSISIDSFGALLPESLERTVIWKDGQTHRGLKGVVAE